MVFGLVGRVVSGTWNFVKRHPVAIATTVVGGIGVVAGVRRLIADAEGLQGELQAYVQEEYARERRKTQLLESMGPDASIVLAAFLRVSQQSIFGHKACNLEAIKAEIKSLDKADREKKLALWLALIRATLTRLFTSTYVLVLLSGTIRVQVAVFTKAVAEGYVPEDGRDKLKTSLCQHAVTHVLTDGLDALITRVDEAVKRATATWSASETVVGPMDLIKVFSRIRSAVEVGDAVADAQSRGGAGDESKDDDVSTLKFARLPILPCVAPPSTNLRIPQVAGAANAKIVAQLFASTLDIMESPNFQYVLHSACDSAFSEVVLASMAAAFPGYRHTAAMCNSTSPTTPPSTTSTLPDLANPRLLLPKVIPRLAKLSKHVLLYPQAPDGSCAPSLPWLALKPSPGCNHFAAVTLSNESLTQLCSEVFRRAELGIDKAT